MVRHTPPCTGTASMNIYLKEIADRALIEKAAIARAGRLPAGARILAIGDSILQFAHRASGPTIENKADGELNWARAHSPRFRHAVWRDPSATSASLVPTFAETSSVDPLFRGANLGLAGDTASGAARRLQAALNTGAEVILFAAGTNVGRADAPADAVIEAISGAANLIVASGRRCILGTLRPRRVNLAPSGIQINPARMQRNLAVNRWIRANAARLGAALWDPFEALRDHAHDAGDPMHGTDAPGVTRDGVHLTPRGAHASALSEARGARSLARAIDEVIAPGLWFDPDPRKANLLVNGMLAHDDASRGADAIAGWSLNATPATAVSAALGPAGGDSGLVIDMRGAGGGAVGQPALVRLQGRARDGQGGTSDHISAFFEVEIEHGGLLLCWQAVLHQGSAILARGLAQNTGTHHEQPYPAQGFRGWIQTEPTRLTAGPIGVRLDLFARQDAAGSARVLVRRALLRAVPDPREEFAWWP